MVTKFYELIPDKVQEPCEFPVWINKPQKPNPSDPYWDYDLPPGPLPDPGAEWGGIGSGFPQGMETPQLAFQSPLGKLPFPDVVDRGRVQALSARAKSLFESIDAEAFEFRRAVTRLHDGSVGPEYWLADVTRFLDAVDMDRSRDLQIVEKLIPHNGRLMRRVHLGFGPVTVFKAAVIGVHHIFRPTYSGQVVFDEFAISKVRRAKLRGPAPWLIGRTDA